MRARIAFAVFALAGCAFGKPRDLTPSYQCNSSSDCGGNACIEQLCAQTVASPYTVVFRVLPDEGPTSASSSYTFDPRPITGSGTLDLTMPDGRIAFGVVRFGSAPVPGQITFRRRSFVAGQFPDEQRALLPGVAWAEDGGEADYRLYRVGTSAIVLFHPGQMRTPPWPGVPPEFLDRPLAEVFPPYVRPLDGTAPTVGFERDDVVYPPGLFQPCVLGSVTCTATGTLISKALDGTMRPESGLHVVLENLDTGEACSTTATTDATGAFAMRVASIDLPFRLRITGSPLRPGFPSLVLPSAVYDPASGGDVIIPRFDSVRYVGRVERAGSPAGDALVRAVSFEQVSDGNVPVYGAAFEATTRTTLSSAPEGAGFFALDLVEGSYSLIVSHAASDSATTSSTAIVRRPFAGGDVLGETIGLGPAFHVGGTVRGPDGQILRYASVDAVPFVPISLFGTTESYAQISHATGDEAGLFDLRVDLGRYDVRFEAPTRVGLAPSVGLDFAVGGTLGRSYVDVDLDYPVVVDGTLRGPDGTPVASAVIEAFVFVPGDMDLVDRTVRIGQVVTDEVGHYVFALPTSVGPLP